MSYHFIDKKDPRIDVMFQGLEKMEKMLSVMEEIPRTLFNGERFLTDEELSKVLRVSRRTLQEYRTLRVIPYYMGTGEGPLQGIRYHEDTGRCLQAVPGRATLGIALPH